MAIRSMLSRASYPRPSIFGRRFGIGENHLMIDGRPVDAPYEDRGALIVRKHHFTGAALTNDWLATLKGSDASCAVPAIVASSPGGRVGLTSGAGSTFTMAVNGSQLVGALNFDIGKGGFEFDASVQMSRITNAVVFIGMADAITLQMPFTVSAGTLTATATNGFGFLFDTAATAATWKFVRVAAGAAGSIVNTGVAPVAATDNQFHVDVSATGVADTYMDGTKIGSGISGCSASGSLLTPTFAIFSRVATSFTANCDFIGVRQYR